jgi:hypothetical protein
MPPKGAQMHSMCTNTIATIETHLHLMQWETIRIGDCPKRSPMQRLKGDVQFLRNARPEGRLKIFEDGRHYGGGGRMPWDCEDDHANTSEYHPFI